MTKPVWEFARVRAAREAGHRGLSLYHLTLHGMVHPIGFFAAFNALAAVGFSLLGRPLVGVAAFVGYCAIDVINQHFIRRWLSGAAEADEDAGFRRLAWLSAFRFSGYLIPTAAVALSGRPGELLFFAMQACTLLAVAISTAALSRRVYWGFAIPVFAAIIFVTVLLLTPPAAAAVLISGASLALLMTLMAEGSNRTVNVLHEAFTDNFAIIPQLETARDQAIAERAAADAAREEARQAGRAKSNFLATMSHEIRTPMNGVLGMAQLLQRDETNPAQKERLAVLIDSGEYLLSILNDILDVSKIDAGRLDILPASEDMRLFLERLVGFWGPRADEKGVALILDMKPGLPAFALIDALRLRQVLFNLVGNALKFTDQGSVSVIADAMPNGEGAVLLHIAVKDTGIGIADQHLPQLFTRFSQGDESEMRKFGGTGLGLSIAKQLIELMGGKVWAESTLGQGSTFHIKVPLAVADGPAQARPAVTDSAVSAVGGLQILAVDDNAVNLLVLDQLLTSFGHEVAKAASGVEALEQMAARPFDLVLLDIQMPGMTGVEVLQQLRAEAGPNRDAPVVALTADVTSGGRERYLELGFTEHSSKPIQIQELMEAVARAMAAPAAKRQAA
ncbi:ATP-binding protein [Phenylobacterium sp.]|jgi:signal transduction histidine kinase/CheY-like chemotaxis protein|uniref:ATP-binding protein n=1 Tax=Phenylobacterium sp. TaxID=1871053 RepID=UPI002E2EEFA5|nr:ATP-binding protein [Phenylobacterium sp.]HEX3366993.1 ATP-binding protein [Phenylobacterium sp.]